MQTCQVHHDGLSFSHTLWPSSNSTERLVTPAISSPWIWTLVIIAAAVLSCWKNGQKRTTHAIPLVTTIPGNQRPAPLLGLLREGYRKFKHENFILRAPHGNQVVVPAKYLDELKSLPESKISLSQSLSDQFLGDSTYIGKHDATMLASIQGDLARNMETAIQALEDETSHAFSELFPAKDWQSARVQPTMLRIVALLSGRVFVGLELSRNEEFVNCIVRYTIDSFLTGEKLRWYPSFLRPVMRLFIPEYNAVQQELADMTRLIRPLVEARMSPNQPSQNNMVDWNMKNSPDSLQADVAYQAMQQLQVSFAAIHTTAKLLTNIAFELSARPDYLEPLRDEIQSCLNNIDPGTPGWTKRKLARLWKLDSFMAETQRHNPPGIMTFNRRTTSDVTLSNGTTFSAGTYLSAASSQIAMDSELWEEPSKFDGFRFERLRQQTGAESKYQFVSTGPHMLLFGYGTHACPGRFFVNNEVKIIVAYLVMNFEMAFPDGQGCPKPITHDVAFKPDPNQEVLVRRR